MRKKIFVIISTFTIGLVIGGLGGLLYQAHVTANALVLLKTIELHESAQRAWQAYFEQTPAVALWALKNHLKKIGELEDIGYPNKSELRVHKLATYVRLAETENRLGNTKATNVNMAKAIGVAANSKMKALHDLKTEDEVLAFVAQLDKKKLP